MGGTRKLGVRQQEIVDRLRKGWKLFYEVGPTYSERGRQFTLGVKSRAYMTKKYCRTLAVSKESVTRLVDRRVVEPVGEWPRENCFDSVTRSVEIILNDHNQRA
jgi:hypothetical protein